MTKKVGIKCGLGIEIFIIFFFNFLNKFYRICFLQLLSINYRKRNVFQQKYLLFFNKCDLKHCSTEFDEQKRNTEKNLVKSWKILQFSLFWKCKFLSVEKNRLIPYLIFETLGSCYFQVSNVKPTFTTFFFTDVD